MAEPEQLQPKAGEEIRKETPVTSATADGAAQPEAKKVLAKTTGERFYDSIQFSLGKVAILVATAALAYTAKYGKDSYAGVPNFLKKFQHGFHNFLLKNKAFPLEEKGELAQRIAGAAANTMVTFHGGNAFAPVMKELENNQENIANYVNDKFGKEGESKISHERLKDKPKQTWGDVAKGRIAAWSTVFVGFMAADTIIGKDKKTGMHWFDKYEEKFGRWVAGFSKAGKDIAKTPVAQALTETQAKNKNYLLGKIAALDIYATSAAIVIWSAVSRSSAEKRQKHDAELKAAEEKLPQPETQEQIAQPATAAKTEMIKPREQRAMPKLNNGFANNRVESKARGEMSVV